MEGILKGIWPTNVYNENEWDDKIRLGWKGLKSFINMTNGEIIGGCLGTGIEDNVEQYEERSTDYCKIGNPYDEECIFVECYCCLSKIFE